MNGRWHKEQEGSKKHEENRKKEERKDSWKVNGNKNEK